MNKEKGIVLGFISFLLIFIILVFAVNSVSGFSVFDKINELGSKLGITGKAIECIPEYDCELQPFLCPPHGKQNKVCKDVKCRAEVREEEVRCSPGKCSGCFLGDKCIVYGTRFINEGNNSYCDVDAQIKIQKASVDESARCNDNYECESNICSAGECVEIQQEIKTFTEPEAKGGRFKEFTIKTLCRTNSFYKGEKYEDCVREYLGSADDLVISIATTKDNYNKGEKIELTSFSSRQISLNEEKLAGRTEQVIIDDNLNLVDSGDEIIIKQSVSEDALGADKSDTVIQERIIDSGIREGDSLVRVGDKWPESFGYIVEFEEEPLIVRDTELRKELKENQEYIEKTTILNPRRIYKRTFGITKEEQVKKRVERHDEKLEREHEIVKERIFEGLGEFIGAFEGGATGRAVSGEESENNKIEILGEFKSVFNGIALDINAEEAEKVKKVGGVKAVYPNKKVELMLQKSVPLIGADKVWNLRDGIDREITGKEVKIAIIDTGVDYTHRDLGSSSLYTKEFDFLKNITSGNIPQGHNLEISGDKFYYSKQDGYFEIYSYNFRTEEVLKESKNDSYSYDKFFIYNNVMFALVHKKSTGEAGFLEFDLSSGSEKVLIQFSNNDRDFRAKRTGRYMFFNFADTINTPEPNYKTYIYDFSSKTFRYIAEGSSAWGVVNGDKVYLGTREDASVTDIYNLETGQLLGNLDNRGLGTAVLDSFGDEILLYRIYLGDYELFNTKTNNLSKVFHIPFISNNTLTSLNYALVWSSMPWLAGLNDRIIVLEDMNWYGGHLNKFYIYDRINNKTISFLDLPFKVNEIKLEGSKICFSNSLLVVYCLDYDSNKEYIIPKLNIFNDKVIDGYDFSDNDNDPMDDNGHGTHVAATAAGKGDYNNNDIYEPEKGEVWGVAPDAKIIAYKVFPNSYESVIIKAIEKAVDPNNDKDFSDKVDIISGSFGMNSGWPDDAQSRAIDNAVDAGIVAVIAAGNGGPFYRTIGSPATSRKAITVGATYKQDYEPFWYTCEDDNKNTFCGHCSKKGEKLWCDHFKDNNPRTNDITSYSSRGPVASLGKPDVVAPGSYICAARYDTIFEKGNPYFYACVDSEHVQLAGTSMATPIVSGAVALIKQKHPNWTAEEIKATLKGTAIDLGEDVFSQGAGRINIQRAIEQNVAYPISFIEAENNFILKSNSKIKVIIDSYGGDYFEGFTLFGAITKDYAIATPFSSILHDEMPYKNKLVEVELTNLDFAEGNGVLLQLETKSAAGTSRSYAYLNLIEGNIAGGYPFKHNSNYVFPYNRFIKLSNYSEPEFLIITTLVEDSLDVRSLKGVSRFIKKRYDYQSAPLVSDINSDGKKEIIIQRFSLSGDQNKDLIAYDLTGEIVEGWPTAASDVEHNYPITAYDFDGDGMKEILTGTRENYKPKALLLSHDGKVLQKYDIFIQGLGTGEPYGKNAPLLIDVDGDGKKEIFGLVNGFYNLGENNYSYLIAYEFNGAVVDGWPVSVPDVNGKRIVGPSMIGGDIDGDGSIEVVMVTQQGLTSFDISSKKADWYVPYDDHSSSCHPLMLSDLTGDGIPEITCFSSSDYKVYVYTNKGERMSSFTVSSSEEFYWINSLISDDVNADGINEIIYGGDRLYFYKWDGSFAEKPIDLGLPGDLVHPVVGDFDLDKYTDVLVFNNYFGVFLINLDLPYKESDTGWPYYYYNLENSRCYDCEKEELEEPLASAERKESKIENNGGKDVSGKLRISIERFEDNEWKDVEEKKIEKDVKIKVGGALRLDEIFNTKGFSLDEEGKYRVYVEFIDNKGEKISASGEFSVV